MNQKLPDARSGARTGWATERITSLMKYWRHRSGIDGRNDRFGWWHGGRVLIIQIALATVSLNWRGTLFEPGGGEARFRSALGGLNWLNPVNEWR